MNGLSKETIKELVLGQKYHFNGTFYTARDQAHKRLNDLIDQGKNLPFNLDGSIIYYCGPTATPLKKVIGSCGPTTSSRMDNFVEPLLKNGLLAMVGKGQRSRKVIELCAKYGAVYFVAPSGCGALLAQRVTKSELVAFADLGPEAVYRLDVVNFPLYLAIDAKGNSLY
ncbi:MAG: FumA C-terminus/TtdB family hydratase beta subunit [Candidatus Omnitrophica bacterium]|nr:FumA C-terminus/TtdB family hydratase beta subunit [Candidatus Omnitrophota bacterium]